MWDVSVSSGIPSLIGTAMTFIAGSLALQVTENSSLSRLYWLNIWAHSQDTL